MNRECEIVRDLMPLCVDGAASEESARYVDEHVAACEQCNAHYEQMKAELPKGAADETKQEQARFAEMAQTMEKWRRWRVRRNVLLGLLAGILLVVGLGWGYKQLAFAYHREYPTGEYRVALSQLEDDRVVAWVDYGGTRRNIGAVVGDNGTERNIWFETTILPQDMAMPLKNGPVSMVRDLDRLERITAGKDGQVTLWRKGEDIPPASPEMEAYYMAEAEMSQLLDSEHLALLRGEEDMGSAMVSQERWEQLTTALESLRARVPEWN